MKILALGLTAFGPFSGERLDLSSGCQGLHLIYGPNEAGKSSALRALHNALYGIPVRSPDNFRHAHNKLRITAAIQDGNGQTLSFVRRKGAKNTLRADDDKKVLEEARLRECLNHIDAPLFTTMFGISHDGLIQGGREIISGGGSLGQILFAAGAGIRGLRDLQAALSENAEELFKPSGKNPVINQLMARVKENRKNLKEIQLASTDWENHHKALTAAMKKKTSAEQDLKTAMAEKNRLERIRQSLPEISRRKKLIMDRQDYLSVVLLPENFSDLRRDAVSKFKIAEKEHSHATDAVGQLEQEIDAVTLSEALLSAADDIEQVFQELGGNKKAARDRIDLENRMDILRSEAAQILKTLRHDMDLEDAEKLRLTKKDILAIQGLGSRYERIITLIETTRDQLPGLAGESAVLDTQLAGLPAARNTASLELAMEAAAEFVSTEIQCQEELAELTLARNSLETELARQRFWSGTLEALTCLSLPAPETVDRFENELDTAATRLETHQAEISRQTAALEETEKKIQHLHLAFSVPTEADLAGAREKRDAIWGLISAAVGSPHDIEKITAQFFEQFPQEKQLLAGFETALSAADDIADRLRRESDRVATLAKLVSDKSDISLKKDHLALKKEKLAADHHRLTEKWQALWSPAGISATTPKEMRQWLHRTNDLVARFADVQKRTARLRATQEKIENRRAKLRAALKTLHESLPETRLSLGEMVKQAGKIIDAEKRLTEKHDAIVAEKSRKTALLSELNIRRHTNEADLEAWQQQWEKAVSPLGLGRDAAPAHASAFLEDLKNLFDKLKDADILKKRIAGIDRDAAAFAARVLELTKTAGPGTSPLSGRPPEQAAAEMMRLLKESRTAASQKQTLEKQLEKERLRQKRSLKEREDAAAVLKTLCEEAGCSDYQQLPAAENRSARRREIEAGIRDAESRLLKMSAGTDLNEFIRDCQTESPDAIPAKITTLTESIDALAQDISSLDQAIGSERTELAKMDGSARAAELAEDTQILLGGLEARVEDYARCKIAAAVLARAIEKYREKNQSPMLQKASRFFSHLTDGSFESIRAEYDALGNPVIAGIRDNGRDIVTVEGMSDGTADQLYLSLRLAALDDYLDKNPAMPFILDDILIQFDDDRARAALETLADLSAKTQIIFFTHHRHLVDLSQKHIDSSVLFCHHLSTR